MKPFNYIFAVSLVLLVTAVIDSVCYDTLTYQGIVQEKNYQQSNSEQPGKFTLMVEVAAGIVEIETDATTWALTRGGEVLRVVAHRGVLGGVYGHRIRSKTP